MVKRRLLRQPFPGLRKVGCDHRHRCLLRRTGDGVASAAKALSVVTTTARILRFVRIEPSQIADALESLSVDAVPLTGRKSLMM